jgi:hypothetical protein
MNKKSKSKIQKNYINDVKYVEGWIEGKRTIILSNKEIYINIIEGKRKKTIYLLNN